MVDNQPNIDAFFTFSKTLRNESLEIGKKLYLSAEYADVHFLFGPKDDPITQIPAHKSILALTSDVFKAMFYGELKEAGNVHVPGVTMAAFMEFLQYFYLNEVKLSAENILTVLHLGDKYNVIKCVNDCFQCLIKSINNQNVCSRLHVAILHEQPGLLKACEKRILMNTATVLKSADFLACDRQVLEHILKMNLFTFLEVKVFEAVMSWVLAKSKADVLSKELVETYLGNLFYEIRFASMSINEFCTLAKKYDSILSCHFKTITNMIVLPDSRAEDSDKFNRNLRQIEWNANAIVEYQWDLPINGWPIGEFIDSTSEIEMVKFSANGPLLLGSFTCGPLNVKCYTVSDFMVNVKIYELCDENDENEDGRLLLKIKTKLKSERTTVVLPQPILIRPGNFYSIEMGPFTKAHKSTMYDTKEEIKLESGVFIKFYDCKTNDAADNVDDDHDGVKWVDTGIIMKLNFNRI